MLKNQKQVQDEGNNGMVVVVVVRSSGSGISDFVACGPDKVLGN
jgi:hypothetical protein